MSDTVLACPACDVADIQTTASSIQEKGAVDHAFRCKKCGHAFDEPRERDRRSTNGLQGAARLLDQTDVEDDRPDGDDSYKRYYGRSA